jgi:ABC-type uncharacterized transport system substrate-binding protein
MKQRKNGLNVLGSIIQESSFVQQYLQILENASNAVVCLSSSPLTDRLLMRNFRSKPKRLIRKIYPENYLD